MFFITAVYFKFRATNVREVCIARSPTSASAVTRVSRLPRCVMSQRNAADVRATVLGAEALPPPVAAACDLTPVGSRLSAARRSRGL